MRNSARVLLTAALLALPRLAAADTSPYPPAAKIKEILMTALEKNVRVSNPEAQVKQRAAVLQVVTKIMHDKIGDPKTLGAQGYAAKLQSFLNEGDNPNGIEQMVAQAVHDLPAAQGTAPGGDDPNENGDPQANNIDKTQVRIAALAVYNSVHHEIVSYVAGNTNVDKPEKPAQPPAGAPSAPAGGTPGTVSTPDPRLGGVAVVANNQAQSQPNNPGAQSNAVIIDYSQGNYAGAYNSAQRYFNAGGADPRTLIAGGRSALQEGDNDFAQQAGARAAEGDPSNKFAQALANLSDGHLGNVDVDGALQKAGAGTLNAGKINADGQAKLDATAIPDGGAAVAAGSNFFGSGKAGGNPQTAAEIAAAAQRAMTTPPTKVEQSSALTKEAASAMRVQDYQKAFTIASQAIDLNPRNAQAWNYRAIADTKLSKYSDAVYDASFSLGLVPGNAPALQTRSWAFAKQQQYKEALADANFTIEKEPSNAFAFQNRAYAQAGLGDKQGALESLRRSAELDPRFKDKYEAALQAPENSDLLFLFNDEPGVKTAPAGLPARGNRFLRLVLLTLFGGLIIALGVLNVVSERWREGMRQTIRRVIGSPAPVAEGGAGATGAFWGGQYEMVRSIGSGGMGVVYEATDRSLDRKVAVKKMRDELRMDPAERQRFVQEARTVASLHHPNIVDIFAIVEEDQDVYLVFEYVAGKTVAEALRDRGTFDLPQARRILAGACAAVEHAHKNKIIHRDIKPSNIMLTDEGVVKVMDFGVARQAKDAMTRQALTNTIVGTPPYMAPEQEQGSVRKESDVFSLAAVFYEMLTGRLPFQGQGAGMLLNKINGKHVPATGIVPTLPAGIDQVISKALAADPEKRYQSPTEFLAAVDAFTASPAS